MTRHATRQRPPAVLNPKVAGEHRWTAMAWFLISPTHAAAAHHGARINLNSDDMMAMIVGCADCKVSYGEAASKPCEELAEAGS